MPRTTSKSKPQLTARQRRRELIAILSIAAARMPPALSIVEGLAIAIPPDSAVSPHVEKLSESGQTCLEVSAEMPLSVSRG